MEVCIHNVKHLSQGNKKTLHDVGAVKRFLAALYALACENDQNITRMAIHFFM